MKISWQQIVLAVVIAMLLATSLMALNIRDNLIATLGLLGLATMAWCISVLVKSFTSEAKKGE